jgi:hypothetical protein
MKIYLDDERATPSDGEWLRCFTAKETIELLKANPGKVEVLSLDHDLGWDEEKLCPVETGLEVLNWLERTVALEGFEPPKEMIVHSANPVGSHRMILAIKSILQLSARRKEENNAS